MSACDVCALIFIIYWGGAMLIPLFKNEISTGARNMKTIIDLIDREWRVDREHRSQPGFVELILSPVGDAQKCQRALTLPNWAAKSAIDHSIKVEVVS